MPAPAVCTVSSTLYGPDGAGYAGALVRARVDSTAPVTVGDGLASLTSRTTTSGADGAWSLTLIQGTTVWIEIPVADVSHLFTVPAAATATLASMTMVRVCG